MAVGEKRAQREPGVSSCKPCRSPDPSDPHSSGVHHGRPLLGPLCAPPRPSFPGLGADSGAENSAGLSSGGSEAQLKCLLLSTVSSSLLPHTPPQPVYCPLCENSDSLHSAPQTWPVFSVHISSHLLLGLRAPGGQRLGSSAGSPWLPHRAWDGRQSNRMMNAGRRLGRLLGPHREPEP